MASTSSSICLSSPPMSVYVPVGRSSTSMAFTRESYSVESRGEKTFATLWPGLRSKKMGRTSRKGVEDEIRVLVHSDKISGL